MPTASILIVEDEKIIAKGIEKRLKGLGYSVAGMASTGEEAIQKAIDLRPALILMDIHLPGMNGIEALRALRADPETRNIPVMAVTASVMPQDRQKVTSAGFDDYQSKPINVKEFLKAVEELLKRGKSP